MDPALATLLTTISTDAIKILGPAAIAAWVSYKVAKHQLEIERVRLHEKDRIAAYKRLFRFARRLENGSFPLATEKRRAFLDAMRGAELQELNADALYLDKESLEILEKLEERYLCMTDGDLAPEMRPDDEETFLEEELFSSAQRLVAQAKNATRIRGVNA